MPGESFIDMSFPAFETPMEKKEREKKIAQLRADIERVKAKIDDTTPGKAVEHFHKVMGQPVGDEPHLLDEERLQFRLGLIDEEYNEFLEAVNEGDLSNAFKELADIVYVVYGLAVEMGGDLDAVFNEVHRSNMTKIGEDGVVKYRDDGKVLKPDTYKKADVNKVLGL